MGEVATGSVASSGDYEEVVHGPVGDSGPFDQFQLRNLDDINKYRATLSIAGTSLAKDLHLDAVSMGYVFSAFGWAYVIGQLPGGWLLDKFGSKKVYIVSLLTWSGFTFLQGPGETALIKAGAPITLGTGPAAGGRAGRQSGVAPLEGTEK